MNSSCQLNNGDISLLFIIAFIFSYFSFCGYSKYCVVKKYIKELYDNVHHIINHLDNIDNQLSNYILLDDVTDENDDSTTLPIKKTSDNNPWLDDILDNDSAEYCNCPSPKIKKTSKNPKFEFIKEDEYSCDNDNINEESDSESETDNDENIKTLHSVIKKVKSESEKENECINI